MSGKKGSFTVRPFEKLRKTMERRTAASSHETTRRKKKEEFTEEELFWNAMGDVQEIETFRSLSCNQQRRPDSSQISRREPDMEARLTLEEIADGTRQLNLPQTQEYVEWVDPDYGNDLTEQLHEGLFSVQACLDLHGHTVPGAEEEMDAFLRDAFKKGFSCVKIIYGRGLRSLKGPRIKNAVIRRLSGHYRKDIIAYASARQCDGGLGAVYVLLAKH